MYHRLPVIIIFIMKTAKRLILYFKAANNYIELEFLHDMCAFEYYFSS